MRYNDYINNYENAIMGSLTLTLLTNKEVHNDQS